MVLLVCVPIILMMALVFTVMAWQFMKAVFWSMPVVVQYLLLRRFVTRSIMMEPKRIRQKEESAQRHQN